MVDVPVATQLEDVLRRYLETILQAVPEDLSYIERRLISDEKWQKYAGDATFRYSGTLRKYEPDLPKLLENKRLVIVGEPGAGKSTVARTVARRFATTGVRTDVPVFLNLRGYAGDLTASLGTLIPHELLSSEAIGRRYVFDGLDEVPRELLHEAKTQINRLLATDRGCGIIITARQAFYAAHSRELGFNLAAFHLLDFDEEDLREYAELRGLNSQEYMDAIYAAGLYDEARNPFNASITAERLAAGERLSSLRSENVAWVVEQVLASRPVLTPLRQRRAVRLLGVGMETYSRNELSRDEAIRIISLGLDLGHEKASEVLDELHHSILIRTPNGVAFQLRSYGELLAAEALQDQPFDRIRKLAFFDDGSPNPSWMNTVTFLAEQNASVRKFFIANHPEWMLEASPAAFDEQERTAIAENVITQLDNNSQFVLHHPTIKARRVFRFLTAQTAERLLRDLDSSRSEVRANAMVILGMAERPEIVEVAFPITLATGRRDLVRYSAIVAMMNGGSSEHVDGILAVLDRADPYYDQLIECAAMLVVPEEIGKVLPYILATNTMLSVVFSRFRELRSRSAVLSLLEYLNAHPDVLDNIRAEGYLNPIIRAIPDVWDEDVATAIARLFIAVEVAHAFGEGRLHRELVRAVVQSDGQNDICSVLLEHFVETKSVPVVICRQIARWMTLIHADYLIHCQATEIIHRLSGWLPPGPVRERLAPHSAGVIPAQDENTERYLAEEASRERERLDRIATKQELLRGGNFDQALNAFYSLEEETWPELTLERRQWLADEISRWFVENDLNRAIVHHGDNSWTQPTFLETLLKIVDRYDLTIPADQQLVLSLRAWSFQTVSNYFRRHGLSPAARARVIVLARDRTQHRNVLSHVLSFIDNSQFSWEEELDDLANIVHDNQIQSHDQSRAAQILITRGIDDQRLRDLRGSPNVSVRDMAFAALVDRQDRQTIARELNRLRQDLTALRAAEVPPPNDSPAGWVTKIRQQWAWNDLRDIRRLTLEHRLPYFCETISRTLYAIDPAATPGLVRAQLQYAPEEWRPRQAVLVAEYERARQFDAARNTSFDQVLEKLKISTSLIALKVWVEGKTDLPIYDKLLREAGQTVLADTLDIVGGWPMLQSRPPERWIDGCREAVIIMDGDCGRRLNKRRKPYTETAKNALSAFSTFPITLYVLERYGIENYFTRTALESVTGRDLSAFMPIPEAISVEDHLVDSRGRFHRFVTRKASWLFTLWRHGTPRSFYRKDLNVDVARRLTNADIEATDLGGVLRDVAARYERIRTE